MLKNIDVIYNENNNFEYDVFLKYYVAFECSLTDNIYSNNLPITYYKINYELDKNRRMFDDINIDIRKPIHNQTEFIKITDPRSKLFINPRSKLFINPRSKLFINPCKE